MWRGLYAQLCQPATFPKFPVPCSTTRAKGVRPPLSATLGGPCETLFQRPAFVRTQDCNSLGKREDCSAKESHVEIMKRLEPGASQEELLREISMPHWQLVNRLTSVTRGGTGGSVTTVTSVGLHLTETAEYAHPLQSI